MIRNFAPLTTLIRNKVNAKKQSFLYNKGVNTKVEDENLFSLKSNYITKSELTPVCHVGLIYRGGKLVCFKGESIEELTLEEAKEHTHFIWNKDTVFVQPAEGKRVYMYWDPKYNDWSFADNKVAYSETYKRIFHANLYNIYNFEPDYTYVFRIQGNARSTKSKIVLETIYHTIKGIELPWKKIDQYAIRFKIECVEFYQFEGFEPIEEDDFPLYVRDKSNRKMYIKSMK